jgi:hypothetical protein
MLAYIGAAVASVDERLVGVEAALVGPAEFRPARRRRRLSAGTGLPTPAALRRLQRRRRDAAGNTWTVWSFDALSAPDRLRALHEIRDFVDWLNGAYELPLSTMAVPGCWYRHPGAVRELWALVASHRNAYTTRDETEVSRPSEAPISWHDRVLWACLLRLREELGLRECVASGHKALIEKVITTDDGFGGAVEKLAAGGWNS